MEEAKIAWNEKVATKIIKNLEKRRMEGSYAPTGDDSPGGNGLSLRLHDSRWTGALGGHR